MRLITGSLSFALALGLTLSAAGAKGTVRVQESTGNVRVYSGVVIRVQHKSLQVTTADGKGTLIIDKAACSSNGALQVCLPTSVKLAQGGKTRPIDFESGTIYANLTDEKQQLPLSSTQIPPHSILMSLRTKIGTYVSVNGAIDEVQQ